uniref:Uncharacterized protein n=1 Tax=Anguilla anguilla TaxID=7936 RepID=A0A0E9WRK6_ANGAN
MCYFIIRRLVTVGTTCCVPFNTVCVKKSHFVTHRLQLCNRSSKWDTKCVESNTKVVTQKVCWILTHPC